MIGIYAIKNIADGKMYIGKSINIERRFMHHFSSAFNQNTVDYNSPLHIAIREFGKDNFVLSIIEQCQKNELNNREFFWINHHDTIYPNGYNINHGGNKLNGRKLSLVEIEEITVLLKQTKIKIEDIAKRYGVSKYLVTRINTGKLWKIGDNYPIRRTNYNSQRLSNDNVKDIIYLLSNTSISMSDIASKYNMREHCISDINRGRTHHIDGVNYPIRNSPYANKRYYN